MTAPDTSAEESPAVEDVQQVEDAGAGLQRDNATTPDVKSDQHRDPNVGGTDNG